MDEGGSPVGPDEDDSGLEPWEQRPANAALGQPAESPLDYHVFEIFCHLGWERSVRKAAEKWFAETNKPLPKNPTSRFHHVAVLWRWQERADAYWKAERKRAEVFLEAKRDELRKRAGDFSARMLTKIELGLPNVRIDPTSKGAAEAYSKTLDIARFSVGDAEEDRKRRGRPSEDGGALPSIDDVLRPQDETEELK